uniref:Uncharacterized protein n=1 Tax=Knipowitschia caucasica TaxID=637954 RepID=A0AAV2KF45_KNICA
MNSQVSITSDLRFAASGICNRVCSLERERNERAWPANVDVAAVTTQAMPLVSAVKEVLTHGEKSAAETATPTVPAPEVYAGTAAERSLRGQQSPKWSEVVKRSRRATTDEANAVRTGQGRKPRATKPIVGTGTVGSIRTIQTKLITSFGRNQSRDNIYSSLWPQG